MIDDTELDRLGHRAADAVRDRASRVSATSAHSPRTRRRVRGSLIAVAVVATTAAVAAAVIVATVLASPPGGVNVSPVGPGDNGTRTESTMPSDEEVRGWLGAVSRDVGPDGVAGYMNESTVNEHLAPRIDPLCAWVDDKLDGATNEQDAFQRLHVAKGGAGGDGLPVVLVAICGYFGDSTDQQVAWERHLREIEAIPNLSDAKKREARDNGPDWFFQAPYQWGEPRPAPTVWDPLGTAPAASRFPDDPRDEDVRQWLEAVAFDDRYRDEGFVAQALDGRVAPLCTWVDRNVEGASDNSEAVKHLAQALGFPDAPPSPGDELYWMVLAICGYHGNAEQQHAMWQAQHEGSTGDPSNYPAPPWFHDAPYLWGDPLTAPVVFDPYQ